MAINETHESTLIGELARIRNRGLGRIGQNHSGLMPLDLPVFSTISRLIDPDEQQVEVIASLVSAAISGLSVGMDRELAQTLFGLGNRPGDPREWRKQAARMVNAPSADSFRKNQERRVLGLIATQILRNPSVDLARPKAKVVFPRHSCGSLAGFIKEYTPRPVEEAKFATFLERGFRRIAFVGLPGMGKTRLVDHCVRTHAGSGDILWFTAGDKDEFLDELHVACGYARIPITPSSENDHERLLTALLQSQNAPAFVVLDGIENTETFARLVPPSPRSIVVATCSYVWPPSRNVADIRVGPLDHEQGIDLVRNRASNLEEQEIERLAASCHGYPLLIGHAAKLITQGSSTADELCATLTYGAPTFLGRIHHPVDGPLATELGHTLEAIRRKDPLAGHLLDCLTFLGHDKLADGLPMEFLEHYVTANRLVSAAAHEIPILVGQAIDVLKDFQIIGKHADSPINAITHACLKAALADRLPEIAAQTLAICQRTWWNTKPHLPLVKDLLNAARHYPGLPLELRDHVEEVLRVLEEPIKA